MENDLAHRIMEEKILRGPSLISDTCQTLVKGIASVGFGSTNLSHEKMILRCVGSFAYVSGTRVQKLLAGWGANLGWQMGFFHKPFQMGPFTPARVAQLPRATLCQTLTAWKFALQNILYILCIINSLKEIYSGLYNFAS